MPISANENAYVGINSYKGKNANIIGKIADKGEISYIGKIAYWVKLPI